MQLITESNQTTKTGLFFIALISDRRLRQEINTFKLDFSKRFGSSRALKVYPHITLKAPFECLINGKRELLNWFTQMNIRQKPFSIKLNGFGAFHNKHNPVVFVKPEVSSELTNMQKQLMIGFDSIFSRVCSSCRCKLQTTHHCCV